MVKKMIKSCEFGRVNRLRIETIEENQKELMTGIKDIKEKNEQMFNHFTETYEAMFKEAMSKSPQWMTVLAGIFGALIGGLAIWALTR